MRLCLAVCLCGIAHAQAPLQLHRPLQRELRPGQTDVFTIDAAAGRYLQVIAQKKGVDVALRIADPAGKTLLTADGPNSGFGPEPASWIARTPGVYSVRVTGERSTETASYEIELTEMREPLPGDAAQMEAETKLYAAAAKDRATDRESRLAAIALYEEVAPAWRRLKQTYLEALCIHRIGNIYSRLGEQQKALDTYRRALVLRRATGDRSAEASTLAGIGFAYHFLAKYPEALDFYRQALTLRRAAGDRFGEATELYYMGLVYATQGETQMALDAYRQALALWRAIGDRSNEAMVLTATGLLYTTRGDTQQALDQYQQALALRRAAGSRSDEALVLASIGDTYKNVGSVQKAIEFYRQALALWQAIGDRAAIASTFMGLGDAYALVAEKQPALEAYQKSLAMATAAGDRRSEAGALIGIANVYSNLNLVGRQKAADADPAELQKALDYYQKAMAYSKASGDQDIHVFALIGAGIAYSAAGEKQKALDYINQSLFLFQFVHFRPGEGWALYEKARVERDLGHLAEALKLVSAAREIIETVRTKMAGQEMRSAFFAGVQDSFELEMDVLMRLDRRADAFAASESARARVLLDMLGEAYADIREGVDPSLLERERTLEAQIQAKETARIQMLAANPFGAAAAEAEKAVRGLAGQKEEVREQIRARSPRYAALTSPQPMSTKEIQQQILDPDTLLLEYSLGYDRSFLWIVSTSEITSVELPKRREVEEAAKRFYDALSRQDGAGRNEAGTALSRMLLGARGTRDLGEKRLLIVADGALQYVPFVALPDPAAPDQPLVVKHEIVSMPSASTLALLRKENLNRKPAPKVLAVFADPVFSPDDSRLSRLQQKQATTRAADEPLVRSSSDVGLAGARLSRLPGTRREAAAIASLVAGAERIQALDFDASRATLTSPEIAQYRILHLATHGLLNSAHPELSGIVLSLVDRQGKPQNGFLRLHEIYNLKLGADLVVLSACQTGLGKEIRGEGLVGLTRGFMYAGAPRVVASLWKVDDRATAELMQRFYRGMLAEKLPAAAALRAAQVAMWKAKAWENPYFWAAFTLQGEWR